MQSTALLMYGLQDYHQTKYLRTNDTPKRDLINMYLDAFVFVFAWCFTVIFNFRHLIFEGPTFGHRFQ